MNADEQPEHWVELGEAAARLGVAPYTLRLAIDGGLLNGRQRADGRWQVLMRLTPEAAPPPTAETSGPAAPIPAAATPEAEAGAAATHQLMLDRLDDLRAMLERREASLSEKDALVADLARGILAHAGTLAERLAARPAAPPASDPRLDVALKSIRETLAQLRDYLQQSRSGPGRP